MARARAPASQLLLAGGRPTLLQDPNPAANMPRTALAVSLANGPILQAPAPAPPPPPAGFQDEEAWVDTVQLCGLVSHGIFAGALRELLAAKPGSAEQLVRVTVEYRHWLLEQEEQPLRECVQEESWRRRWATTHQAGPCLLSLCSPTLAEGAARLPPCAPCWLFSLWLCAAQLCLPCPAPATGGVLRRGKH